MFSKRSLEGYLQIDHRNSPGLPPDFAKSIGLVGPSVGAGVNYESPTITCSHCNAVVVLNPLRTRPRNHCRKCDAYTCDRCSARDCRPFSKLLDDYETKILKGLNNG